MLQKGFRNFYWGFLFVMIDFRVNGFDILPDIVGYMFFLIGMNMLAERSHHFKQARIFHIIMLALSIFSIYENQGQNGINISPDFMFGLLLTILTLVIELLAFYHLFMGIKGWAEDESAPHLAAEADHRWKQFLYLALAGLGVWLIIWIPPLAMIYIIALLLISVVLCVKFMGFMTRCGEWQQGPE